MKRTLIISLGLLACAFGFVSFSGSGAADPYHDTYKRRLAAFGSAQEELLKLISRSDPGNAQDREKIGAQIAEARKKLKGLDFWLRYLEPVSYKKINGPLPVEWETEVFEKYEKPYRREGAGLTLAELYLDESTPKIDSLAGLIRSAQQALKVFSADSITAQLNTHHHFFLCNRLFLLNLAAIYTTGFECPDSERIVPELRQMLSDVREIYDDFNTSFNHHQLPSAYVELYERAILFVNLQPASSERFDHFSFLKDFVNPLFALNQEMIRVHKVRSRSYMDYTLNNNCNSIFSKSLYSGQNTKGVFHRVQDPAVLAELEETGRLLFYDPILSGNNRRSCASCHDPASCFTDTLRRTSLQFDGQKNLARNSPSLVNAPYNHLLMLDGRHLTLQEQAKAVITNSLEMSCDEKELIKKVLSCKDYNKAFKRLVKHTPQEPEPGLQHISSALTWYYGRFSNYYAPFDRAMNGQETIDSEARKGFNIFMSKAQCATCHFVPQFNGVKPPYIGSEFEVLGVPADTAYKSLSADRGRFGVNPAGETANAFRTGTLRNIGRSAPYMHNGVFGNLEQVIEFYNTGGGRGHGLSLENQTLSADSLHLTKEEIHSLLAFMRSLDEAIPASRIPAQLPLSKNKNLNGRKPGGNY